MKSFQITKWGAPLEARDHTDPEPEGTEVLVKIDACGVCHSDIHIQDGYFDLGDGKRLDLDRGVDLPLTPGHEIVGRIAAIGPEAQDVSVGDRRIVYPWIGCGACSACERDEELLCPRPRSLGTSVDGGYSDHVLVPHPRYLVDYEGIPMELAGTFACSGITAYNALKKANAAAPGDDVLVIGAGGVGLSAIHLAPAMTGGHVIAADLDPAKRDAAKKAGATAAVDNADKGALKQIRELTGGGVAAAIDFVGRPETARFGLDAVRRGGTVVVVGLFGDAMPLPVAMLPLKMATMTGSYVGTLQDLREVVALAQAGQLPPIPIETRPFAAANAALDDLRGGRIVGRVVLVAS